MAFTGRTIFNSIRGAPKKLSNHPRPFFRLGPNHTCQQYLNPSVEAVPLTLQYFPHQKYSNDIWL
jgi:hypothetical protein